MSEVERRTHWRSAGALLLELLMIGVGVFLGASAEQCRDTRHHREVATASLRDFRREVANNRTSIAERRDYHTALAQRVSDFTESKGPRSFRDFSVAVRFEGMRPVDFEHTAWDLALATQSMGDINPRLAYSISNVYTTQQAFAQLQTSFLQSTFSPSTFGAKDATGLAVALQLYLGDVNIQEPRLVRLYDRLLPQLDSALGGPPRDSSKVASVSKPAGAR